MKETHRAFLSVLGIYLGGSWVVLQVVDLLQQNLGLPTWAFSLALVLLIIGLPIMLATAWLQSRVQAIPERTRTPGSADRQRAPGMFSTIATPGELFTWRNAALGGLAAMALWGVVATFWLVRTELSEQGDAAAASALTVEGPRGTLVLDVGVPGVTVEARRVDLSAPDGLGPTVDLGSTPLSDVTLPAGNVFLRFAGPDVAPLSLIVDIPADDTASVDVRLLPESPLTRHMVMVAAGPSPAGVGGTPVDTFLIDRHEVTNRDFAEFMSDDGYATPSLWPDSMTVDAEKLPRSEALSRFVDRTGAPGPRSWSGAVFPARSADHPVSGVSWYEAHAYCSWRGGRLPSAEQWWRAAVGSGERRYPWGDEEAPSVRANFEATGTVPVESLPLGVSPFGAFEMAGNVREWLRPHDDDGAALSVGGSWQDPVYTFSPEWQEPLPLWFANETTGFRCARHA